MSEIRITKMTAPAGRVAAGFKDGEAAAAAEPEEVFQAVGGSQSETHPLTRRESRRSAAPPVLESTCGGGAPVELADLFYKPHWSKYQRALCNACTFVGFLTCFAAMIAATVGFVNVLSYIREKERVRKIGLFMVPNIIDDGDAILRYDFNNTNSPAQIRQIDQYVSEIESFLAPYYAQNESYVTCNEGSGPDTLCRFDLKTLGGDCTRENKFGFYDHNPCVLLGVRQIAGYWRPTVNNDYFTTIRYQFSPDRYKEFKTDHFPVQCTKGSNYYQPRDWDSGWDRQQAGFFTYYPTAGFPIKSAPLYPGRDQLVPLVFIRLNRLEELTGSRIECKLYADNVEQLNGVKKIVFQLNETTDPF